MSEAANGGGGTVAYIQHHLTNLCAGEGCETGGFWSWHLDTITVSSLLALLIVLVGWRLTRRNTLPAKPGGNPSHRPTRRDSGRRKWRHWPEKIAPAGRREGS